MKENVSFICIQQTLFYQVSKSLVNLNLLTGFIEKFRPHILGHLARQEKHHEIAKN